MKSIQTCVLVGVFMLAAGTLSAQDTGKPAVVPMATSKFASLPIVPPCLTLSAQSGDPTKGASMLLIKMKPNCVVPWHWHTANEQLMFVSGKGKIEMKGEAAHSVTGGDYVRLPSKHVHQFTCVTGCVFFDHTDAAFDVHYVDKDGKELPPEQALKPASAHKGKSK